MRLNRAPLLCLGYRALRLGSANLESHATARRALCPPADYTALPALYPEGALDRILSMSPWRDRDTEMALVKGKGGHHAASAALEIRDAVMTGESRYRRGARVRVGHGASRVKDDLPPHRFATPDNEPADFMDMRFGVVPGDLQGAGSRSIWMRLSSC